MDPRIERADDRDLPEILRLVHRAYARNESLGFQFVGVSERPESLFVDWAAGHVFKLVDADAIAGSIRMASRHPEGRLDVWRLCVDPPLQRRGFGGRLLRFAEAEARRRSLGRIRLDTAKPFVELVGWYERQGYRVVGETRFPDVNYDSVILEKPVDEGAAGIV